MLEILKLHPGGDEFDNWANERYRYGRREGCAAYVFAEAEVWDGLWEETQGRRTPICNGLLFDWSSWIKEQDRSNANAMQAALEALSPGDGDTLSVGPVQRLSVRDSRDVPTIHTAWAGAVPILHAAAGVRRVCTVAYVLTWAWKEHRLVADRLGEPTTGSVIMLSDEVFVTTHSPLVMASAESWFDPDQDAWFDLDLEGELPRAVLHERRYLPRGSAGAWLTSEAFDLATDRGSAEAEAAIVRARALLGDANPELPAIMAAHEALRAALPDVDEFLVRWNAFVERNGGEPLFPRVRRRNHRTSTARCDSRACAQSRNWSGKHRGVERATDLLRSFALENGGYPSGLRRRREMPREPRSSGSRASIRIHTSDTVSSPTAVNRGLSRLNQFQSSRMATNSSP